MLKRTHQASDKFFKTTISDRRVARDFFMAHLPKTLLKQIDLSTLELQQQTFIDPRYRAFAADVIYKAKLTTGEVYVCALIEHQTKPERWLPLRIADYKLRLASDHHKKYPDQPLPVIVPLIVYTGDTAYTHSTDFFELFGAGKELAKEQWITPIQLIDICRESDDTMEQHPWFGLVEFAFKYRHVQEFATVLDKLLRWIHALEQQGGIDLGKNVLYYVMEHFDEGDVDTLLTKADHYLSHELRGEAMTIAQQLEERGRQQGIQQGMQQGVEILAVKLLADGMAVEKVSQLTALSVDRLRQLSAEKKTN